MSKAANRNDPAKPLERDPALEQVRHHHVPGLEPCVVESGRHFAIAVGPFLAQDGYRDLLVPC